MRYELNGSDETAQTFNMLKELDSANVEVFDVSMLCQAFNSERIHLTGNEKIRVLDIDNLPFKMKEDNATCLIDEYSVALVSVFFRKRKGSPGEVILTTKRTT
jgi:hypothetical protein